MYPDATVVALVLNEATVAKAIHQAVHKGTIHSDHFSQSFLSDMRNEGLEIVRRVELCHEEEGTSQALLAGAAAAVNQGSLGLHGAEEQEFHEEVEHSAFFVEDAEHFGSLNS